MRWRCAATALLFVFSQPALAQDRCVATRYELPPSITEALRPYLLCGLIHDRGDTGVLVNGIGVTSMWGPRLAQCQDVRARAYAAAWQRLAATMPEPETRETYLNAELKKADAFLIAASNLDDLGIGEKSNAPPCRTNNAQN